MKQYF
ncbi:Dihydrofolate reductase, partial [Haemophilus influenzae]